MTRLDDREVAPVEGREVRLVKPFADRDHGGIDDAQIEVDVLVEQLNDPVPVGGLDGFGEQLAGAQRCRERALGRGTDPIGEEVCDLGDDERSGRGIDSSSE